ncbi:MAG: hypothetical protein H7315_04965 [Herminiimonas sp.]|nr:hypothetical protein [Herminiimonas sp.]
MHKIDMPSCTINRSLMLVRCKQPFVDWLQQVEPDAMADVTLELVNADGDVFLIPEKMDAHDARHWFDNRWPMLFDHMLGAWVVDETKWPEERSILLFHEWFSVEYRSMIWDLCREPLAIEDWARDSGEIEDDGESRLH